MVQLVVDGVDLSGFTDDVIAAIESSAGDREAAAALARIAALNMTRDAPLSIELQRLVLRIALVHADREPLTARPADPGFMPVPRGGKYAVDRSQWNWSKHPLPSGATDGQRGRMSSATGARAWRDFEQQCARIMRGNGDYDAEVRSGTNDGGIDVESGRTVAQVKRQTAVVGRPVVQQLYGAAQDAGKAAEIYTTSGYTREAIAFARRTGVRLFVVDEQHGNASRVD